MIKNERFQQGTITFDVSYINECGGRDINEDTVLVKQYQAGTLFSMADGLGGHGGGDVASKIATDMAGEEYGQLTRPGNKAIQKIFTAIDRIINKKQTDEIQMKTTLACVFCKDNWMYVAHIGDTRVYIFKNKKDIYVTEDHSVAYEEMIFNNNSLDDIRYNPNRHILTAALGVTNLRKPNIFKKRISPGISVLICSDGFWEYVNEEEMIEALEKTTSSADWMQEMLKYHSAKIDEFNDNYSAICVRLLK